MSNVLLANSWKRLSQNIRQVRQIQREKKYKNATGQCYFTATANNIIHLVGPKQNTSYRKFFIGAGVVTMAGYVLFYKDYTGYISFYKDYALFVIVRELYKNDLFTDFAQQFQAITSLSNNIQNKADMSKYLLMLFVTTILSHTSGEEMNKIVRKSFKDPQLVYFLHSDKSVIYTLIGLHSLVRLHDKDSADSIWEEVESIPMRLFIDIVRNQSNFANMDKTTYLHLIQLLETGSGNWFSRGMLEGMFAELGCEEAIEDCYKVAMRNDVLFPAFYYLGMSRMCQLNKKFAKARNILNQFVSRSKNNNDIDKAKLTLIALDIEENDAKYLDKKTTLGQLKEISDSDEKALVSARLYYKLGEVLEALKCTRSITKLTPEAEILKGHCYLALKHIDASYESKAEEIYKKNLNYSDEACIGLRKIWESKKPTNSKEVDDFLNSYTTSDYDFALMCENSYHSGCSPKLKKKGWVMLTNSNQLDLNQHSFYATAFYHEDKKEIVIAFRGTELPLMDHRGDLQADTNLVWDRVDVQSGLAKVFYHKVVEMIDNKEKKTEWEKYKGCYLSITGHSLGAVLAETIVWLHRDRPAIYGVTFESPGTKELIQSMERNRNAELDLQNANIKCYLSNPNVINSAKSHIGKLYHLTEPNIDDPLPITEVQSWLGMLSSWLSIGAKTVSEHKMKRILTAFDEVTGEPKNVRKILDWPRGVMELNTIRTLLYDRGINNASNVFLPVHQEFLLKYGGHYETEPVQLRTGNCSDFGKKSLDKLTRIPTFSDYYFINNNEITIKSNLSIDRLRRYLLKIT